MAPDGFFKKAPQERVFVHYNSSVIFPGEYFLYSLYAQNSSTGELSKLSKIAYVELLGENGETVFRQKVKLENGRGSADFFIPTTVPSGNYKLLAYTNWMRNVKNNFFESDVVVINPYQSNQAELLEGNTLQSSQVESSEESRDMNYAETSQLSMELEKRSFDRRDYVKLTIHPKSGGMEKGSYSLSVRKKESLPFSATSAATGISPGNISSTDGEIVNLPELRGEIISGQLLLNGGPAEEQTVVALSIPSEEGFPRLAVTNKEGQFFFNVSSDIRNKDAVLAVMSGDAKDFRFQLDQEETIDLSALNFPDFKLTPQMKEVILERSIYNQIENAFFAVKPDTLIPPQNNLPIPANLVETYNLDEYTRFKSVPETFVEIIESAWVKKNSSGESAFQVRGVMNYVEMGLLPLVMVDGVLVPDHNVPANMDARRIKSIKIIRNKLYLGPASFQGAILFETIGGDYYQELSGSNLHKFDLFTPEIPKKYFRQVYTEESKSNRIPDYRYQLLWIPELNLNKGANTVEFYTSDVKGDFEVVLEGFTAEGKPVSIREEFRVE